MYCNPQHDYASEPVDMSLQYARELFRRVYCFRRKPTHVYPFMNSDPLIEPRLHSFAESAKTMLNAYVMVSTNGVLYKRRMLLNTPLIDEVSFTISAATPETYLKVHGKYCFNESLSTLSWLNLHGNCRIGVRYVLTGNNVGELDAWRRMFKGYRQEVWATHYSDHRVVSKEQVCDEHPLLKHYRKRRVEHFKRNNVPCNCFHNLAVGVHGEVMQCCDLPYSMNWGHFMEVDLAEVWSKRLELGLNHEGCKSCSRKNPEWKELFEKHVW